MLKAIILEDERAGLENLKNLLAQNCPDLEIIADGGSIKEGLKLLKKPEKQPDVVFLDINLPDGLVFQLLDQLPEIRFELIFVTAYQKFMKTACNYACIGYVDKPIDPDELIAAVNRVTPRSKASTKMRYEVFKEHYFNPNPFDKICISSQRKIILLEIKDVMYLLGDDNLTHFYVSDGKKYTCCKTLLTYEYLEKFNFLRIHRGSIVNLNFIQEYIRNESYVLMKSQAKLEVAKRRRPRLMKVLLGKD